MCASPICCSLCCGNTASLIYGQIPLVEKYVVGVHAKFGRRPVRELPPELVEALVGFIRPKNSPRNTWDVSGLGEICILRRLAESWNRCIEIAEQQPGV